MNRTLRLETCRRSVIVKQARPWVEKYPQIPAPSDRALVEAAFYRFASHVPAVQERMPRLLGVDADSRILVLEDLGDSRDFTGLYRGETLRPADLDELVAYLAALHVTPVDEASRPIFANRAMRMLNHEYIFDLPLRSDNGLDLDAIASGLAEAAAPLKQNHAYVQAVSGLGRRYLADGPALLHGDFFPGSWLGTPAGPRVIDPEFCLLGPPAFDLGVLVAHLLLAQQPAGLIGRLFDRYDQVAGDRSGRREPSNTSPRSLALQFAGVEVMRRIIGVARVPVQGGVEALAGLLERSRTLVLDPGAANLA